MLTCVGPVGFGVGLVVGLTDGDRVGSWVMSNALHFVPP